MSENIKRCDSCWKPKTSIATNYSIIAQTC